MEYPQRICSAIVIMKDFYKIIEDCLHIHLFLAHLSIQNLHNLHKVI